MNLAKKEKVPLKLPLLFFQELIRPVTKDSYFSKALICSFISSKVHLLNCFIQISV